jgi:hypothetical protein
VLVGTTNEADDEDATVTVSADRRLQTVRRFPEYASLIRPAPTTVGDIRASLRADEALLSFYFGSRESFVWAIPKDGPIAFAQLALNATQLQGKVTALRAALDPPFGVGQRHPELRRGGRA